MPKSALVLLASTALLLPAAVVATPAEAASSSGSATITNRAKTRYGVTVRIKVRDEGRSMRVRVSHPRGDGNFKEPRVQWTKSRVSYEGEAPPPDDSGGQLGGGGAISPLHSGPSFREDGTGPWDRTTVSTTFKLKNGKSIHLACRVP